MFNFVLLLYATCPVHPCSADEPPYLMQPLSIAIDAISAATDLLITASLVALLRNIRTGFKG